MVILRVRVKVRVIKVYEALGVEVKVCQFNDHI